MVSRDFALQVTFYDKNYGSVLQAYALQRFLNKYGIDCILISEKYSLFERICRSFERRLAFFFKKLSYSEIGDEKQRQIEANKLSLEGLDAISSLEIQGFISDELCMKKLTYRELRCLSRNNKCRFCLAGSDQIWNGSRVYFNPLYFLSFAPKKKRFAFAPSFGSDEIKSYNIGRYSKSIKAFEKLSVREKSGLDIIKKITGKDAVVLLDPVFLLDIGEWKQLEIRSKECKIENRYVFAFFLNSPSVDACNKICNLYADGLCIVTIGYAHNLSKLNIPIIEINGGPKEFLTLIDRATLVCTDSFHATAFSAIFHKQFYVFERNYVSTKQSARITEFLL